jgi:hypothetical protein
MKKAAIFDLDNCLAPATEVGKDLYERASWIEIRFVPHFNRWPQTSVTFEPATLA